MAVEALLDAGLIGKNPNPDKDEPMYAITDKGTAHVENLKSLVLPVNVWVLPPDNPPINREE